MTGNEKEFSKIIAFAALLNVGLNGFLIPFFGIEGAATATMITTITWNLGVVWVAWTELRIRPALVSLP
jgi:O-antigen/teichoic acid export membrane protein